MKKVGLVIIGLLLCTGCATNMSTSAAIPGGGNTHVNVDSNGNARGSVNIAGVNVNTSL